eukprot:jgi/Phyca11/17262/fgenesh1_pg.PHYCAscaffold_26_\
MRQKLLGNRVTAAVSKTDERINVSAELKAVCAVMQNILETSDVPEYNVNTRTGVWRIVTVNPADKTPEERDAVKDLVQFSPPNLERVVGIEICKPATYDAEVNAALNIVKNVTFVNSKATDAMEDLLRKKREDNEKHLIRVVGPPSAGLHHLGIPRSLSK